VKPGETLVLPASLVFYIVGDPSLMGESMTQDFQFSWAERPLIRLARFCVFGVLPGFADFSAVIGPSFF
jgi:hypothetical protein